MLSVGLTGNIASGKSLVASQLESLGAVVLDADRLGHRLIGPMGAAVDEILAAFGSDLALPDGGIDRTRLGPIVFGDPGARSRLNGIVHPRLIEQIRGELAALEAAEGRGNQDGVPSPALIAVLDAALIFELGVADDFDRIVVVTAPDAIRETR
ncbi:MAG: dephospho-CoA kinase, partial [bacterium]